MQRKEGDTMTETLSFPGLGLEFNINPVVFQITETWGVKWYGILVTMGFVCGCFYAISQSKKFGLDPDRVLDVLLGVSIGSIVGARAYYVIFSWDTYRNNLSGIFKTWEGGIAIYGGIIAGVLVCIIMCRLRGVKLLPMLDAGLTGVLAGQAIGRWGNFVNMEAFGTNTELPWGMTSPTIMRYLEYNQAHLAAQGIGVDPLLPVHPTFFYESAWCFLGFLLLVWMTKRRRYDGQLALLYAGWYGLGRFGIEGLRTDSLMWGGIRVSQALALLCVIAAAALMAAVHRRAGKSGGFPPLYVNTAEGQAIVAGTFYKTKEAKEESPIPEGGEAANTEEPPGMEEGAETQNPGEGAEASETPEAPDAAEAVKPEESGENL